MQTNQEIILCTVMVTPSQLYVNWVDCSFIGVSDTESNTTINWIIQQQSSLNSSPPLGKSGFESLLIYYCEKEFIAVLLSFQLQFWDVTDAALMLRVIWVRLVYGCVNAMVYWLFSLHLNSIRFCSNFIYLFCKEEPKQNTMWVNRCVMGREGESERESADLLESPKPIVVCWTMFPAGENALLMHVCICAWCHMPGVGCLESKRDGKSKSI